MAFVQEGRLNIFTLISDWTVFFFFNCVCMEDMCMEVGHTHTHYAMPVKAVELVLSPLHIGSGAQTQQHLYL